MLKRFILASAMGQMLGLVISRLMSAGVTEVVSDPTSSASQIGLPLLMLTTGGIEGACIGAAQGQVLRETGRTTRLRFALYTAGAMVMSWALGMSLTFVEPSTPPSEAFRVLAAGTAGAVLGAIVGIAQRRALDDAPLGYVGWSATAWSAALIVTLVAESYVPNGPFSVLGLGISLLGGAASGAVVGAIIGEPALRR